MHIGQTRTEMLAIVESLRLQLSSEADACRIQEHVDLARRQVQRIRKEFKRVIDKRARTKSGDQWFPIHAREGIERKLAEATAESLAAIDSLATDRGLPRN